MPLRHSAIPLLLLPVLAAAQAAPPSPQLTAEVIMQRVAANQERAEVERARYVFVQHAHAVSRKGHRDMCEESTDFRVTPTANGVTRQLMHLEGRLWQKGSYVVYHELEQAKPNAGDGVSVTVTDDDMDRDLVENMRKNLTDEDSRDGFHAGLFPISSKGQQQYLFTLAGRERMNGREVFHITFRPRDTSDYDWKGDAYIDTEAFQPVLIRTRLARNVPFLVRTMLGTSVPGLGLSIGYQPQPDGVWFPTSFGTEFRIHVLFVFRRTVAITAENTDFQKTHAESHILGEARLLSEPAPSTPQEPSPAVAGPKQP